MLMHLGQDFSTPKPLFSDKKTLRKNPFYLRLYFRCDPPHASDSCSGERQEAGIQGARLDASPA